MHGSKTIQLPTHDNPQSLANDFNEFFVNKISTIRTNLEQNPIPLPDTLPPPSQFNGTPLSEFPPVNEEMVDKLLSGSRTTSSPQDPIPTRMLKACTALFLPVLTLLVNLSLSRGEFSSSLKKAFVIPLLKKANLDADIFKNFRPVSQLSFLSKLIERAVCKFLIAHLVTNNLYEVNQSAYRSHHSTETALLRVQNDILRSIDRDGGALLVMLDLSAAFDTIDHATLLHMLEHQCGITGTALKWFSEYISDRYQAVQVGQSFSEFVKMEFGVPQGSVLGPILFTCYTRPIADIIRSHNIPFHFYADDTQLYISFRPRDDVSRAEVVARVESCVADIRAWMTANYLKLNDDKTELVVLSSTPHSTSPISITVGGDVVNTSVDPPRNLGVYFDDTLSMDAHIKRLKRSLNGCLYSIGKMRKYLDRETAITLINCMVGSRLDYCNSLFYGISERNLNILQLAQNRAARIISFTPKFRSISGVRRELHWLPIRQRIDFKVLVICWRALHGVAPAYIREMVTRRVAPRTTRSTARDLLVVPRTRLKTFGDRSFSAAAPALWNSLPENLKQLPTLDAFKRNLKTHLFAIAYDT